MAWLMRRNARAVAAALRLAQPSGLAHRGSIASVTRWPLVRCLEASQRRSFAMHASILNQMDLLAARYDELSTELSKCVCYIYEGPQSGT